MDLSGTENNWNCVINKSKQTAGLMGLGMRQGFIQGLRTGTFLGVPLMTRHFSGYKIYCCFTSLSITANNLVH